MKKLIISLLALLVLCGCVSSAPTVNVSDGDAVIFETPDNKAFTKQQLFDYTKKLEISASLKNSLIMQLAKLEGIDTDAIRKEAEDYIEDIKAQGYGDFITQYYGSEEAYIEGYVPFQTATELCTKYVESDLNAYVDNYEPFKAAVIYFDNEESAKGTLDTMNNSDSTFAYAATSNGYTSEVTETVFSNTDTELPSLIKEYVKNNDAPSVSPIIQVDEVTTDAEGNSKTNSRYYLINLVSKNVNDFKDEFLAVVTSELDQNTVVANLLKKYNISVHDQTVYETLKSVYGEVIK